jgi:ABC-type lipoprotein export system ATPase subunit
MLKSLKLENFTVFAEAELEFSPGINVIIGENGTGKTHLLKAAYCLNRAWPDLTLGDSALTQKRADVYFEERLKKIFQPDYLINLIRWGNAKGHISVEIDAFDRMRLQDGREIDINNRTSSPFEHQIRHLFWQVAIQEDGSLGVIIPENVPASVWLARSILIPSKEVVSFYEGLGGILKEYKIKLDATYLDMVNNFDFPELYSFPIETVLNELEDSIGGKLSLEGRRLVFVSKDGRKIETPLLAEGLRKLAILPYFIRHGLIEGHGETLFWDEPEANLNPRLVAKLAEALVTLARHGVQVILATHSLFLLKEIDLQLQLAAESLSAIPARFFALTVDGDNGAKISAGENLEEVDPITALDMEIDQSDRYNDWYYRVSRAE